MILSALAPAGLTLLGFLTGAGNPKSLMTSSAAAPPGPPRSAHVRAPRPRAIATRRGRPESRYAPGPRRTGCALGTRGPAGWLPPAIGRPVASSPGTVDSSTP